VMVMKKGLTVYGVVLDENGRPLQGATVIQGHDRWGSPSVPATETDAQGRFCFANAKPGELMLTFQAEGYAPELIALDVNAQTRLLEVRLAKAHTIRGRVLDKEGRPIAGAWVGADTWRGHRSIKWETETDAQGRFLWSNAPPDEVKFCITKEGFVRNSTYSLKPSEEEQIVTLLPPQRIHGTVVDADTGQPVTRFKTILGVACGDDGHAFWDGPRPSVAFTNGRYEIEIYSEPSCVSYVETIVNWQKMITTNTVSQGHVVRVEADGYQPAVSRAFKTDEGTLVVDFKLKKAGRLTGVIRLPNGSPAVGADVALAWTGSGVHLSDGRLIKSEMGQAVVATAGTDGSFSLPVERETFTLVAVHDGGFAAIPSDALNVPVQITLQPWGRVEGTFFVGTKPMSNQEIRMNYVPMGARIRTVYNAVSTDESSHFAFDRVRPGVVILYPSAMSLEVKPGETVTVALGGTGQPVIGRLVAPAGFENQIDWVGLSPHVSTVIPLSKFPEQWSTMTQEEKNQWRLMEMHPYPMVISADGSFRVEDVSSGTYEVQISLTEPLSNGVSIVRHSFRREFTVPELPNGRSDVPLDLGDFELQRIEFPK
jgi:hypothetical protein